ncbi:MAG: hypothetical protein M5U17_08970 [Ignavibacterium sp.]|nr:hypothetical protein [Ignavibacterium sp.]
MITEEIFSKALNSKYIIIKEHELHTVLKDAEILREENTYLSDHIRLLKYNDILFIQEITFKKEVLLRKMDSMKDADSFIQERLDYYERKWDGCGCKIDYYK